MGVLQTPHRRGKQTRLGTVVLDSFSCLSAFSTCCSFRTLAKSNVGPFNFSIVRWGIGRVEGRPGVSDILAAHCLEFTRFRATYLTWPWIYACRIKGTGRSVSMSMTDQYLLAF